MGPYRVLRELGRGGMGVVYLAERDDQLFEKQVAIKLLETQLQPQILVRRFESERRILARLEHPAIARLIDAGIGTAAKPYFVLEYVDGVTLSELLRSKKLKPKECLDLFLKVCSAVSYAHHQLVVHLDLKPGNIMVKPDGSPKLLDFGLAKMLDPITGEGGDPTVMHMRILTPAYASPEQKRGEPLTVASDVYSLGRILQTMLPEPEGDLVNILDLALKEESQERYQSVEQFAEDIERYLKGMPVAAREDTLMYRVGKFVRRRKWPLAAALVSVASLIIGFSVAVYQARRAEQRFNQVRQLSNSFLFEFHDAVKDLPGATPVRELILQRAQQYLDSLANDAGGDNNLKREVAVSYRKLGEAQGLYYEANLGKRNEAQVNFKKALDIFEELARKQPYIPSLQGEVAITTLRYASTLDEKEALEIDRKLAAKLEPIVKRLPQIQGMRFALAGCYFGMAEKLVSNKKYPEALENYATASTMVDSMVKDFPNNPEWQTWVSRVAKRMAAAYINVPDKSEQAFASLKKALEVDERVLARQPNSPNAKMEVAMDISYDATFSARVKDYDRAEKQYNRSIEMREAVAALDPRNMRVRSLLASDYVKLAGAYRLTNRPAEARRKLEMAAKFVEGITDPKSSADAKQSLKEEMEKQAGK